VTYPRDWVEQLDKDCSDPRKNKGEDEFIKAGGVIVIPWIREMNIWLSMLSFVFLCFTYSPWVKMILFMSFVHIADNFLLQRAAIIRHRNKSGGGSIIVAVGVPVQDVEVGFTVV
jgi:hypothetical protein